MKRIAFAVVALLAATAAQWSEPVNVTRCEPNTAAWYPSLTIDSAGTLHASWSHTMSDMNDWIEYACKPEGVDTWTRPVHVSRRSFPLTGSVVVIGPGGVPHVVWQSEAQAGFLYISHRDGDTWTTPQRHEGWNRGGSGIRADADRFHRVHVVWYDLSYEYIWYALYDDSGWHGPEAAACDTVTPFAFAYPDVAPDRLGRPHVTCQQNVNDSAGPAYFHRNAPGWTQPAYLPRWQSPPVVEEPRVGFDSTEQVHVVWKDAGHAVACRSAGDSWTPPERLDSLNGVAPVVSTDSWNQVHVVFGDAPRGLVERTWYRGAWVTTTVVDTHSGHAELAAGRARLHALWRKSYGAQDLANLWYSSRPLSPPGIIAPRGGSPLGRPAFGQNPITPGSSVEVTFTRSETVSIDVSDTAGRSVRRIELGRHGPGRLVLRAVDYVPSSGVFVLTIRVGSTRRVVKLVRPQ